jgi:hypothetical protein
MLIDDSECSGSFSSGPSSPDKYPYGFRRLKIQFREVVLGYPEFLHMGHYEKPRRILVIPKLR